MLVKLHSKPIRYIEIRDFLDPETLARWRGMVSRIETQPGDVAAKSGWYSVNPVKKNLNAWLNPPNLLADEFRALAWSQEVRRALDSMGDYLFTAHSTVDEGSFLLTHYDQGDYYSWHRDNTPYLTYNLVLNTADEGGEFELTLDRQEPFTTTETLDNAANTLIIFPSFMYHRVKPVIAGRRTTIQYFQNASRTASQ